ncbi:MAG: ankyrin repeat domain-containing protein [Pseudomonadota bacterium]
MFSIIRCLLTAATLGVSALAALANDNPQDLLSAALRAGDVGAVTAALEAGADPNGGTIPPLSIATARGDSGVVEVLLAVGADPNTIDATGRSILMSALVRQRYSVAKVLVANGVDVNLPEENPAGRSPLQLVIDESPSIEAMDLLLSAGADINFRDARGETALASAAFMNRPDAARYLIEKGADLSLRNNEGVSPLGRALQRGNAEVIELLRDAGMSD